MKVNLFKTASTASASGRPRTAPRTSHGESIRGKISGPIPIPSALDDDEFPIRQPGSGIASKTPDDEFPIRQRGVGIASPIPLDEGPAPVEQEHSELPHQGQDDGPDTTGVGPSGSGSRPDASFGEAHTPEVPPNPPPTAPASGPARATPTSVASASATASGSGASPTQHKRANPSSTLRYSVVSTASGNTGEQAESKPQRKKSTLRGALSKLFGRKKKNNGSHSSAGGDTDRTSSLMPLQHRSDTSALGRVKEAEPKRSASLPITEYDRALRSHSIGPGDITAIDAARSSLTGNSPNAESSSAGRRRAATTSNSNLYGPASAMRRGEMGEWGGLSPRPVSTHGPGRGSRLLAGGDGEDDPNMIGRAITSDMGLLGASSGGEYTHRRRSRSLSGIDTTEGQAEPRRRSDEIRYWRESYGASFLSPVSSAHPEKDDDDDAMAGAGDNDNDNDDTGVLSLDLSGLTPAGASSVPAPPISAVDRQPESQQRHPPKTPPQPFNFGSLANASQMAGMTKITQAADIEIRIGGLESRMQRMERVVDQLCHAVPGFRAGAPLLASDYIPRSVPSGMDSSFMLGGTSVSPPVLPAVYQALAGGLDASSRYSSTRHSMETGGDAHSHTSFGEGQTYIGSLHPPSSSATQALSVPATVSAVGGGGGGAALASQTPPRQPSPAFRPTSTSTVRGTTSLPALAASAAEQSDALVAQLEAERASRAALEMQVKKLSERVNTLSTTMFAMLRDPQKSRSHERLTPTPTGGGGGDNNKSGSQLSTPTKTKPDGGTGTAPVVVSLSVPPPPQSSAAIAAASAPASATGKKPGSIFEDDDDDDESDADSKRDDEEESFLTPREERHPPPPHRYGAFGEELRPEDDDDNDGPSGGGGGGAASGEDDPKRKKAARTLSLSQLTMGKGQRNVI